MPARGRAHRGDNNSRAWLRTRARERGKARRVAGGADLGERPEGEECVEEVGEPEEPGVGISESEGRNMDCRRLEPPTLGEAELADGDGIIGGAAVAAAAMPAPDGVCDARMPSGTCGMG